MWPITTDKSDCKSQTLCYFVKVPGGKCNFRDLTVFGDDIGLPIGLGHHIMGRIRICQSGQVIVVRCLIFSMDVPNGAVN